MVMDKEKEIEPFVLCGYGKQVYLVHNKDSFIYKRRIINFTDERESDALCLLVLNF